MTALASSVAEVVRSAASSVADGRATLTITRLSELRGLDPHELDDWPLVTLTPTTPHAASLRVLVEGDELSEATLWVWADDGPGTELYVGMKEDRLALLADLVRAVVAGRYSHGPRGELRRGQLRKRLVRGWEETFLIEGRPFTSTHYGLRNVPATRRTFAPY